jgi:ABC-type amino acid transport system permease subunit
VVAIVAVSGVVGVPVVALVVPGRRVVVDVPVRAVVAPAGVVKVVPAIVPA